jgi:6-phosphogluconolactonase
MRARTFSALYGVIAFLVVVGAGFLSGCMSGRQQFAYAAGQGTNEVFEFQVHGNGTMSPLATPNFPVGSNPSAVALHTSGDFLYIADFSGNDVTLLDINASNGNLSVPVSNSVVTTVNPPNIFSAGGGPVSLQMSPTAPFLFVANQTSDSVTSYAVDPGTGSLGLIGNFSIAPVSHPTSLAVSPKGDFLFVANGTEGTVAVFSIDGHGVLAQAGTPVSLGVGATPNTVAVEHSGRFVYVSDSAHNVLLGFSIQSGGALAPIAGSPFATGAAPLGIGIDPEGAFLFVANSGSNTVSAYLIDSTSGALGQVSGSPFPTGGAGPSAVAVDTTTSFVYVTDQASHDIAAFSIASNGTLKTITGSPFGVATSSSTIAVVSR